MGVRKVKERGNEMMVVISEKKRRQREERGRGVAEQEVWHPKEGVTHWHCS